ncbi:phage major capsid protein [Pleionea sediminis]|uniref:phage major capsid protein n=1 Tax=Pleionea sediminis TaxID=2569479 RepID=UPI001185CD77|nr:phage major capsid protein [Pleionea sediminis]
MLTIESLKAHLATIKGRIVEIAKLESSGETLTEEQITEFNSLEEEFDTYQEKLKRAEAAERLEITEIESNGDNVEVIGKVEKPIEKGQAIGLFTRAIAANKGSLRDAAHFAEQEGYPTIGAALNTQTGSAGGFVVPPGYSREFIEILRPSVLMRNLNGGCREIPMPDGQLEMGRGASSASASYQAEGEDIIKSEPSFGDFKLSKKKLTGLVPVSNDLVRFGTSEANQFVLDDIVQVVAEREDLAFLRDDGTGNLVKGLRYQAIPSNLIVSSGNSALDIERDFQKLIGCLRRNNIKMTRPGIVLSERTFTFLETLRDQNGHKVYPELSESGRIGKVPVGWSTTIPENLGANGDETEVYLVDFHHAVIGEAHRLTLDVSTEASYKDGTELVSAFSRDQTVIRVIEEHDFGLRHGGAAAILTGVRWGL